MGERVCRICSHKLPIGSFGVDSAKKDGLQTACKPCNAQRCKDSKKRTRDGESLRGKNGRSEETRLNELNILEQKQKVAVQYRTMKVETDSVQAFEMMIPSFEVRRWQDGTKSDVGIRLRGCAVDRWLPIQLKASKSASFVQFRMRGKDGLLPNCDTICMAMQQPVIAFMFAKEQIANMKISKCGLLSMFNMEAWMAKSIAPAELNRVLLERWQCLDLTSTEETLRMQVNDNHRKEMLNISLSNRLLPDSVVTWPETPMSVFDLIRDGQKEQYKSVQTPANGFQGGDCSKMKCGTKVAYELGDNDWYVFGYINEEFGLYLSWRIPESFMDHAGMLSRRDKDGKFVYPGRRSMPLHVVGPNGENENVHRIVIGELPRSDVVPTTFPFVRVLWF